jgi:hypothetical protein
MFTPIKDEVQSLLQDLILLQGVIIDEQNETANNACAYIKYEGMLSQLQQDIERVSETCANINMLIQDIMKNAMDGNYSAKMKLVEEENILLRKKIDIYDSQTKIIANNLNNGNKIRAGQKLKKIKENTDVEKNLEL